MKLRDNKGSITIFVLVGLLFMTGFLIISFGSNVNKSKSAKEQFNILSSIYSYKDGDENAYKRAYTAIRKRNAQILTESSENSSILKLTKTFTDTISDYKIYGNSIQDTATNGTPSPDNPVEIQSVGDRTNNLIDAQDGLVYHTNPYSPGYNWERTETGFKVKFLQSYESGSWLRHGYRIGTTEELAGKTITVSYGEYIGASQRPTIGIITTNIEGETAINFDNVSSYKNGYIGSTGTTTMLLDNYNNVTSKKVTYTIPETLEDKFVGVIFYLNVEAKTSIGDTVEYKNIQVKIGDTATDYEPYGKYKIPVKVSGKNLLNKEKSEENYYINSSGVKTFSVGFGLSLTEKIYVKPSTTYTYSGMGNVKVTTVGRTGYQYDKDGNPISPIKQSYGEDVTFTTDVYCNYILLIYVKTEEKPMLEESDIEPIITNIYLDEPLRKIGNYADYIDFSNGKVVRQIRSLNFNVSQMNNSEDYPGWRNNNILYEDFGEQNIYLGNVANGVLYNIYTDKNTCRNKYQKW